MPPSLIFIVILKVYNSCEDGVLPQKEQFQPSFSLKFLTVKNRFSKERAPVTNIAISVFKKTFYTLILDSYFRQNKLNNLCHYFDAIHKVYILFVGILLLLSFLLLLYFNRHSQRSFSACIYKIIILLRLKIDLALHYLHLNLKKITLN